ncbi:MAG: succinate dehydrogenase, cytochrome b556 subunit [Gammaproteobacteria bacterium]|nr:succinate dehydrogenase, cytochrome b556 subunit [Gammaproteobacteria bacterium]
MKSKRPINLDLTTLSFPPMAIASILHRVSGIVLFLLLPLVLYVLDLSLQSSSSFAQLQTMFSCWCFKLGLWIFGAALIYHLLAGVRHIIADLGWGETVPFARFTAYLVMALALGSVLLLGIWIW